jgi:putative flippase GtrA
VQFFLYLTVGGLAFLVEISVFVALRRASMPVIPASVTSFLIATAANYLLSVMLAFQRGRFSRHIELTRFLVVVLVGLALNTALVWLFVYPLAIPPTAAKIAAVPIVLVWNYLGRRLRVFGDEVPAPVRFWLEPLGRALLGSRLAKRASEHSRPAHQRTHCTVSIDQRIGLAVRGILKWKI